MKAMILAAGRGARMRPLTDSVPKPLLKVLGRSLIEFHLLALAKVGVTDVVINTWHLGRQIVDVIGSGAGFGLNITYSNEDQLLGTGGGIVKALPLLGSEPFILLSADIFTDFDLNILPTEPLGMAHLVLVDNPNYHNNGDFSLNGNTVKLLNSSNAGNFTYANIGVYRPEFFATAPDGPFELGDLLRHQVANQLITGQYYSGVWDNVGTPLQLEILNSK